MDEIGIYYEEIARETAAAWLLVLDSADPLDPQTEWFPKSQCRLEEENDGSGHVVMPDWLAYEKGLA